MVFYCFVLSGSLYDLSVCLSISYLASEKELCANLMAQKEEGILIQIDKQTNRQTDKQTDNTDRQTYR
jgi:hypothetical protein